MKISRRKNTGRKFSKLWWSKKCVALKELNGPATTKR